jgi:hypothetical protein
MSAIESFKIILTKAQFTYDEQVKGLISFTVNNKVQVKMIKLTVSGVGKVNW